jgi:hypothetical protein
MFSATCAKKVLDTLRPLLADTVEKLACGLALDFRRFEFARERSH